MGIAFGFLVSLPLLSGNESGQVNILFLLLLFVGIPLVSLVILIGSVFKKEPLVVQHIKKACLFFGQQSSFQASENMNRLLLLYHGQYCAIGWALGSLSALMLLLLFTDINFVWRSTLLSPETLLPALTWIASPWYFWESAQPSLALLNATQDSRLTDHDGTTVAFGQWWPFIIACQLFYALLLRSMAMLIVYLKIGRALSYQKKRNDTHVTKPHNHTKQAKTEVVSTLPRDYVVVNWAKLDIDTLNQLEPLISLKQVFSAGPLATEEQNNQAQAQNKPQVILVKAWEPPLEELKDYLLAKNGVLFPVEIKGNQVTDLKPSQIEEWCRFIATTPNWSVFVKEDDR